METTRFFDGVFNADKRNATPSLQALAKWLTIEQLTKLQDNEQTN